MLTFAGYGFKVSSVWRRREFHIPQNQSARALLPSVRLTIVAPDRHERPTTLSENAEQKILIMRAGFFGALVNSSSFEAKL